MGRDIRIDTLRGSLILVMTVVHLLPPGHQVLYDNLSVFEGFMLVSGLVTGLWLTRLEDRRGATVACRIALRRAGAIYLGHIGPFLAIALACAASADYRYYVSYLNPSLAEDPTGAIPFALVLLHRTTFFNILPMYVVFVAVSPFVLAASTRYGARPVMAAITLVWLASITVLDAATIEDGLGRLVASPNFVLGDYSELAWGLLFGGGLLVGRACARGRNPIPYNDGLLAVALTLLAIGYGLRHGVVDLPGGSWINAAIDDREVLSPVRIAAMAVLGYVVYGLATRLPGLFTVPPIALIGRHALACFAFHIVAAYTIGIGWPVLAARLPVPPEVTGWMAVIAGTAALYLFAAALDRRRGRPAYGRIAAGGSVTRRYDERGS